MPAPGAALRPPLMLNPSRRTFTRVFMEMTRWVLPPEIVVVLTDGLRWEKRVSPAVKPP